MWPHCLEKYTYIHIRVKHTHIHIHTYHHIYIRIYIACFNCRLCEFSRTFEKPNPNQQFELLQTLDFYLCQSIYCSCIKICRATSSCLPPWLRKHGDGRWSWCADHAHECPSSDGDPCEGAPASCAQCPQTICNSDR